MIRPVSRRRLLGYLAALPVLAACAPAAPPTAAPPPTKPAGAPATAAAVPQAPPAAVPTASAAGGGAPTKLELILDWSPNTNHSGIYLAKAKRWYAEQGIDLDIQIPTDPSASMKLVGAGKAELGISYQSAIEIARAQDVPVVSVGAILQHNTAAYAAKTNKNVTRPKDFEGKKFGTSGLAQIEPTLRTVMKCDSADFSKVQMVNVGQKLTPALLADQVDVISMLPAWEGIDLELKGNQLSYLPQTKWCVPDVYTILFLSSEDTIKTKPELIRRFMVATAQGYEYAAKNAAEAAETLRVAVPELDAALVKKSQEVLSTQYIADAPRWGIQTAGQWQKHATWMADNQLIAKPIDTAKAFTNDFLPKP